MTSQDRRSVGELLTECDLTTRRLLSDPDSLDAAAMVRTWPEVVQAAHELLDVLPTAHRVARPQAAPGDLTGERLHLMATSLDANLRQRVWPGQGPPDEQLLSLAGTLQRAHDLVHAHLRRTHALSPAAKADAAAARTKVLHALYVGAHAITLAVRSQSRQPRVSTDTLTARRHRSQLNALATAQARLAAFEQVAGAEVYRNFPRAPTAERHDTLPPDRLRTALAAWDIQTRRALARQPAMATLAEVTRVQTTVLAATRVVLDAAAGTRAMDPLTYRAQLEPRLTATESAWGDLHGTFRDLTGHAHGPTNADLRAAGGQLIQALCALVLDGTAVADPATIAARTDLLEAVRTLTDALAAPREIAGLLLDAALDPRTRVSALGAQQLLSQLAADPTTGVVDSPDQAWVNPRDLAARRTVPPPRPVRDAITQQVQAVGATSRVLAAAPIPLSTPPRATPPDTLVPELSGPIPRPHSALQPARAPGYAR